jgi:alpha-1,2-mannosyltransferase
MVMRDRDEVTAPTRSAHADDGWWLLVTGLLVFAAVLAAMVTMATLHPYGYLRMSDLMVYRLAGAVARHSGPLYSDRFLRDALRFTYPPAAAMVFAVLSFLPFYVLKLLMTLASLLALLGSSWLAWGSAGVRGPVVRAGATLVLAGFALWSDPVQQTLGFGQVNLVLMVVVLADMLSSDRRWWKGAGVGLAAGLKLTPAIFILYLLVTRRVRAAVTAMAVFALSVAAGFVMLPGPSHRYWLDGLFLDSGRTGNNAYAANQSIYGMIERVTHGSGMARPCWIGLSFAVGIGGLLTAAWAHRRGHELAGIVACAVTGLLISPVSWDHHWVWITPLLGVILAPAWRVAKVRPVPVRPVLGWLAFLRPVLPWLGAAAVGLVFWQNPLPFGPLHNTGLIWTVPHAGKLEYTWTGMQLVTGNLYLLTGFVVLCAVAIKLAATRSEVRPENPVEGSNAQSRPQDSSTEVSGAARQPVCAAGIASNLTDRA